MDEEDPRHWVEELVAQGEPVGSTRLDAPLILGATEAGEFLIDFALGSGAENRAVMMRLVFSVEAATLALQGLQRWKAWQDGRGEETPFPRAQ